LQFAFILACLISTIMSMVHRCQSSWNLPKHVGDENRFCSWKRGREGMANEKRGARVIRGSSLARCCSWGEGQVEEGWIVTLFFFARLQFCCCGCRLDLAWAAAALPNGQGQMKRITFCFAANSVNGIFRVPSSLQNGQAGQSSRNAPSCAGLCLFSHQFLFSLLKVNLFFNLSVCASFLKSWFHASRRISSSISH
jgi:hypothetical protein